MTERYAAADLTAFATHLGTGVGLPADRAETMASVLVEGDLLGHDTHGLKLLPGYLGDIASGASPATGDPQVIRDTGATLTWDGRYLPGTWLVAHAIDVARDRVKTHGVATVVIRRSHHIACLAAFLQRATDHGLMILLASSDPSVGSVAPYGGLDPLYTPNPLAVGIPTSGEPVLIDISMSTTTNGMTGRLAAEGARLPGPWIIDGHGRPTDDPSALNQDPPGSILPLGGMDLGYKGFALGIMIEALTSGLNGFGRAQRPTQWGASVFLQLIDPDAFAGRDAFTAETGHFADAARGSRVAPGAPPVRMPGERGLKRRADQLAHGVALHRGILPTLRPWADKLGVAVPRPLS